MRHEVVGAWCRVRCLDRVVDLFSPNKCISSLSAKDQRTTHVRLCVSVCVRACVRACMCVSVSVCMPVYVSV